MNETQTRRGPGLGVLLLIPAVVIIAKAASHRGGRSHGRHRFGGFEAEGPRSFRIPPRIEGALDDWHTRAHESTDPTAPASDASA